MSADSGDDDDEVQRFIGLSLRSSYLSSMRKRTVSNQIFPWSYLAVYLVEFPCLSVKL